MKKNNVARRLSLVLLCAGVAAVLVACGGGSSNDDASDPVAQTEREAAQGLFNHLPVSWAPTKLVFDLNPGTRQTVPVTLTTTRALTNARIVFVPDLRNAVSVSPETIPSLAAGQTATVTLTFAPAANDRRKAIAGVVLLFDRNATVSRPLPVKVSLVPQETINGVSVPPAPPAELNNATLAGFDVNANGVRDDVDRLLAAEFPTKAATLLPIARAEQSVISSPTATTAQTHGNLVRCALERGLVTVQELDRLTYGLINTKARRNAYAINLAGTGSEECT